MNASVCVIDGERAGERENSRVNASQGRTTVPIAIIYQMISVECSGAQFDVTIRIVIEQSLKSAVRSLRVAQIF